MFRFKMHAFRTNELYVAAARTLVMLATALDDASRDALAILAPMGVMVGEPWWDFAVPVDAEDLRGGDLAGYRKAVREEAMESLNLLRQALLVEPVGAGVVRLERIGALSADKVGECRCLKPYEDDLAEMAQEYRVTHAREDCFVHVRKKLSSNRDLKALNDLTKGGKFYTVNLEKWGQ